MTTPPIPRAAAQLLALAEAHRWRTVLAAEDNTVTVAGGRGSNGETFSCTWSKTARWTRLERSTYQQDRLTRPRHRALTHLREIIQDGQVVVDRTAEVERLRQQRAALQADLDRMSARVTVEDPAACRLSPAGLRQRQRGYDQALARTADLVEQLRRIDRQIESRMS